MRAVAALLVTLALAGCAQTATSPQDDARGTAQTLLRQCAHGRADRILPLLVPAGQAAFAHAGHTLSGCARILRLPRGVTPGAADYAAATVEITRFGGQSAEARVALAGMHPSLELSYGTEFWRISGPH